MSSAQSLLVSRLCYFTGRTWGMQLGVLGRLKVVSPALVPKESRTQKTQVVQLCCPPEGPGQFHMILTEPLEKDPALGEKAPWEGE